MAIPIPYAYRLQIIRLRQSGLSYAQIALEVPYSYSSIKRLCQRYKAQGEEGLQTRYHQSGRQPLYPSRLADKIAEIRDGEQGAAYVRSMLLSQYPQASIPHERTLQRWWQEQQTARPKGRPKNRSSWTKEAHHTWQIDGKGLLPLKNGQQVAWLKIADEATGSDLATRLFPL